MGTQLLTTASTIQCPHGGSLTLVTTNTRVSAGARVLTVDDTHLVSGCTHQPGGTQSPCVRVTWSAGANAVSIGGSAALTRASVGSCVNAVGVSQGVAFVANTQRKAAAR